MRRTLLDRSKTHYDLRDAFAGDGCPICALTQAAVDRYFATLNYEAAGDRGVRAHLRQTLGFCQPHAHQWLAAAHVLATAVIYAEVLDQARNDLRSLSYRRSGPRSHPSCARGVAANPTLPTTFPPVPRPHARPASSTPTPRRCCSAPSSPASPTPPSATPSPAPPASAYPTCAPPSPRPRTKPRSPPSATPPLHKRRALLAHLQEVIRKHDYRFTEELAGEERGAGSRAIRHVVR